MGIAPFTQITDQGSAMIERSLDDRNRMIPLDCKFLVSTIKGLREFDGLNYINLNMTLVRSEDW